MARLHDETNLRYAGLAVVAGAFLGGALIGSGLELELCGTRPSIARIGMVTGAVLIVLLDLVLRATHREAAERLGMRRFVEAEAGARIARVIPAWMAGVVLLLYTAQDGLRHGFC